MAPRRTRSLRSSVGLRSRKTNDTSRPVRPKRKQQTRRKELKLYIAKRVIEGGESKAAISRELNIPESSIRTWCKQRANIMRSLGRDIDGRFVRSIRSGRRRSNKRTRPLAKDSSINRANEEWIYFLGTTLSIWAEVEGLRRLNKNKKKLK